MGHIMVDDLPELHDHVGEFDVENVVSIVIVDGIRDFSSRR